mgnify:CR=1 FL=1
MPDFTDLISQAKKMQKKMKETQEMLKKIEVEGISGADSVKVIMNGDGELTKITLDDALLMPTSIVVCNHVRAVFERPCRMHRCVRQGKRR